MLMKFDIPACSQVFVDQLTSTDMEFVGDSIFPSIGKEIIAKMVEFSNKVGSSSLLLYGFNYLMF